jgi:hypothetical protein
LDPMLSWVEDEVWLDIHRLESADVSRSLTGPYIEQTLLASHSLFPRAGQVESGQMAAMRLAIRLLTRYRFFTRSHLLHHVNNDEEFREILKSADWEYGDLWRALGRTALLRKPLDEIWQEFHPAIRRLLFRYYYPTAGQRALAHREAGEYTAQWAAMQLRKDRVVGQVEELWHVVSALRMEGTDAADLRERLLATARDAGTKLDVTDAYPLTDLSAYAAERIARDAELQAAIGDAGLAMELNDSVLAWAQALT